VCIFLCPRTFAMDAESRNILAVFAGAAADSLATASEYERNLASAKLSRLDARRARTLQIQLTPRYRRNGPIVLWADLQPADDLAGDILIARPRPQGGLAVWAADVAGRGLSAGWSMMFIRQLLGELPTDIPSPAAALGEINARLYEIESDSPPDGLFATGIGLIIDDTSKSVRLTRAGAPRIYMVRSDSGAEVLEPDGFPLGLFHDAELEETSVPFKPGDKLVWASDGLLGAQNDSNERWGEERLVELLNSGCFLPGRAIYEHILTGIGEFGAVESPHDDRSLMVIGFDSAPTWEKSRPGAEKFRLLDESLAFLGKQKLADADFNALKLILDEAIRNANEHGNKGEPDAAIEVRITVHPKFIHLRVRDEGGKLNERVTSVPLRAENLLEDKGRGFLLMRHHSDHLWVEDDRGELNAVRLRGGA
jgi:serine phosphatase RsbU (regulator of sigma subunit)/anti-sigma regulatory factor (Ser/Thr protein kinase)